MANFQSFFGSSAPSLNVQTPGELPSYNVRGWNIGFSPLSYVHPSADTPPSQPSTPSQVAPIIPPTNYQAGQSLAPGIQHEQNLQNGQLDTNGMQNPYTSSQTPVDGSVGLNTQGMHPNGIFGSGGYNPMSGSVNLGSNFGAGLSNSIFGGF
jgi:hypothetical protein